MNQLFQFIHRLSAIQLAVATLQVVALILIIYVCAVKFMRMVPNPFKSFRQKKASKPANRFKSELQREAQISELKDACYSFGLVICIGIAVIHYRAIIF